MSKILKLALAVGGVAALWLLTRNEDDTSQPSYGRPASGGTGSTSSTGSSGAAASSGGASSQKETSSSTSGSSEGETPAADGGIVRDGRMRGGTWNFAPSDAPKDARGFLVLRDVPKSSVSVDGKIVELRGGFRGFRDVPAGTHKLELEGYGGVKVPYEIDMPAGGCVVLIYEDSGGNPRLEADRDWGPQYIGLAMGGAMGQALWPWPDEE